MPEVALDAKVEGVKETNPYQARSYSELSPAVFASNFSFPATINPHYISRYSHVYFLDFKQQTERRNVINDISRYEVTRANGYCIIKTILEANRSYVHQTEDCKNCQGDCWCVNKETLFHADIFTEDLLQMRAMDDFQWRESKKEGKDVGRKRANLDWVFKGCATLFRGFIREGVRNSQELSHRCIDPILPD